MIILKRMVVIITAFVLIFVCASYVKFLEFKKHQNMRKFFNIVLIGAAGSGKGTQGEIIREHMHLLPISAGEVLRQYRSNPDAKYTKIINRYIDKGQLVPTEITNNLMAEYIQKNVFCSGCKHKGIIFDGFPRQMEQLEFLDKFLKMNNNQIDAVVYIDVPVEALVERLSGRFSCATCGTLYHKKHKPTKVNGVCDQCGGTQFKTRSDDQDIDAIRTRFKIFEDTTKPVLNNYKERGLVLSVNGNMGPKEISDGLLPRLDEIYKIKTTEQS